MQTFFWGPGWSAAIDRLLRRTLVRPVRYAADATTVAQCTGSSTETLCSSVPSMSLWFKKNLFSTLFLLPVLLLTSCEKVIDINLTEGEKKYVVEGNISNRNLDIAEVRLSQTVPFNNEGSFNGVSGATISVRVNDTASYVFTSVSPGVYQNALLKGVPGYRYHLTVSVGSNLFTARSTMPQQLVRLDTLTVTDLSFGGSTFKTVQPSYQDPPGPGNSYRFIQYANGSLVRRVFVQNDAVSDGLRITRPLINPDGELKSGDVVRADMLHIDPNVYRYWFSLDAAATGQDQSATPANPVTNIQGGALGYFSAHSVSTKTIVLP